MSTYTTYIGMSNVRTIKAADWTTLGIANTGDTTWSVTNGWSIDESTLSAGQIAYLAAQADFVTLQPNPRAQSQLVDNPFGYVTQASLNAALQGASVGAELQSALLAASTSMTVTTAFADIPLTPLAIAPTLITRAVDINALLLVQPSSACTLVADIFDSVANAVLGYDMAFTIVAGGFATIPLSIPQNPGAGVRQYRPQFKVTSGSAAVGIYGRNQGSGSRVWCVQK